MVVFVVMVVIFVLLGVGVFGWVNRLWDLILFFKLIIFSGFSLYISIEFVFFVSIDFDFIIYVLV